MKKAIFKQPNFYIAIMNFFLGIFYIFQDGTLAKVTSFIWLISFIVNFYLANRAANKKASRE